MKLFFLVFGLFIASASSFAEDTSNFIVGGSDATIRDYPYMAGVLNFGVSTCGGSILTSRSILTVGLVIA